jgi:ankyrin repeat protein
MTWINLLIQGSADGTPIDIINALAHGVDLTVDLKKYKNKNNNNNNSKTNHHHDHHDRHQYPLHLACQKGSLICVYLLVMNGIDIFERNESGFMSSEIAEFHGHHEVASLLKKRQEMLKSFSPTKYQNEMIINPVAAETPTLTDATEADGVSELLVSDPQLESSLETTTDFTSPDPENPFYDEDLKMI